MDTTHSNARLPDDRPVNISMTDSQHVAAERLWQDAAAAVAADVEDDAVTEAYEVYRAEVARARLVDRAGDVQVTLASGTVLRGRSMPALAVEDCLVLRTTDGVEAVVPTAAVMIVRGGAPRLRPESAEQPPRLTTWLREREGALLRVQLRDGTRWQAVLVAVASDHVVLHLPGQGERIAVATAAVELWGWA